MIHLSAEPFRKLIALRREILLGPGLDAVDVDCAVFDLRDLDDVEETVFISAANRMAELMGLATFRIDEYHLLAIGRDVEDARAKMRTWAERMDGVELED